jgi:SAM-dependent methyltransferase
VPQAISFRSHGFDDSTVITSEFVRRGFQYDSNLCLYLQAGLFPLEHQSGLLRFPVFWEDDIHGARSGGDWRLAQYRDAFFTPGLKIFNFHPFWVAANIPNAEYYHAVKQHTKSLGAQDVGEVAFKGEGTRTFLIQLLQALRSQREPTYTLEQLYGMFRRRAAVGVADAPGRNTEHSEEEYQRYLRMSDAEKQQFLRKSYSQRNAADPYATSRDYNMRDLEIEAIGDHLGSAARIADLGCGNGYTLLSLASRAERREMTGVDFTESLIAGANQLASERAPQLLSHPTFLCEDALQFVRNSADSRFDCLITQRFLQNLPTPEAQRGAIREIHRTLMAGGRFLMCEGAMGGFNALNEVRAAVGLSRIPATGRDNPSSVRFQDAELEAFAEGLGFRLLNKVGFSTYFLIARVLHPLLVAPQSPRFNARINDLAKLIQQHTARAPGYGSNVLWIFERL